MECDVGFLKVLSNSSSNRVGSKSVLYSNFFEDIFSHAVRPKRSGFFRNDAEEKSTHVPKQPLLQGDMDGSGAADRQCELD